MALRAFLRRSVTASRRGWILRGAVQELRSLRAALDRHNALLERLVDVFAPVAVAPHTAEALRHDSGVDFLDAEEAAIVTAYVARCENDLGHPPTEEQILRFLADQKTTSLQARLAIREDELHRLSSRGGE